MGAVPLVLEPGVLRDVFGRLALEAQAKAGAALEPVAVEIETRAKQNASQGQHAYGTKTPARPGSGPARISGTLVGSITHTTPHMSVTGWECRVGLVGGRFPPYSSRVASSRYGYYLEVPGAGRSRVRYPFLKPAAEAVGAASARAVFAKVFSTGWRTL